MKLALQIAAGIILAFIAIMLIIGGGVQYQQEQALKEFARYQKKVSARIKKQTDLAKKKEAPVAEISSGSNPPAQDSSALARKNYLESQERKKLRADNVTSKAIKRSPEEIEKNREILNQLIKKNK